MRKSQNFDLNLYEGTDIFNPLTTDVPNYEKIDSQMEKNYNLSVGKATELKTGTVHAITRENVNCPMIHFTATSNFTSNDTFTVDGVQVSALLVDGSTLPTNCYIIGSEVICYLKGTLLTFFLSGSVSKDSEKLGGELPSFYAKNSELSDLKNSQNAISELLQNVSNSVVEINEHFDYYNECLIGDFNGKKLYRKYVKLPCSSMVGTSSLQSVAINHGILNIEEVIDFNFKIGEYSLPYFNREKKEVSTCIESVTKNEVKFLNNANWSNYFVAGYIYYTKGL